MVEAIGAHAVASRRDQLRQEIYVGMADAPEPLLLATRCLGNSETPCIATIQAPGVPGSLQWHEDVNSMPLSCNSNLCQFYATQLQQ